jgi:hypothetical protein
MLRIEFKWQANFRKTVYMTLCQSAGAVKASGGIPDLSTEVDLPVS